MIKKKYLITVITILIISCFILSIIIFIFSNKIKNIDVNLHFDENKAYRSIKSQIEIGNRIPGTNDSNETINYFVQKFQDINPNITNIIQKFDVKSTDCQNLLIKINEKEDDIVILGAHYDSRAKATKDNDNRDKPVPGANDGASGCAVLLELARNLYKEKNDLDCQIWFVFFDAEDQGEDEGGYGIDGWDWCEGSNEFVEHIEDFYDSDSEFFECMILLDMVGGTNLQFIKEQYSTSSLVDELFQIGSNLGYNKEFPTFSYSSSVTDDHIAFAEKGIPSADLIIKFWNNPDWPYHHTTNDDIDHISKESLKVTGSTIEQFIYNNYLDKSWNTYKGNKPWQTDINALDTELVIFLGLFIAGLSGFIGLIYYIKIRNNTNSP